MAIAPDDQSLSTPGSRELYGEAPELYERIIAHARREADKAPVTPEARARVLALLGLQEKGS